MHIPYQKEIMYDEITEEHEMMFIQLTFHKYRVRFDTNLFMKFQFKIFFIVVRV